MSPARAELRHHEDKKTDKTAADILTDVGRLLYDSEDWPTRLATGSGIQSGGAAQRPARKYGDWPGPRHNH